MPGHEEYMRVALQEARKGRGSVEPNPMVGALIVEDDEIVAQAHHEKFGELHAERLALNQLGRRPKPGATMYVILEPCSTEGKTDACTGHLAVSGISRVVVGAIDPNPAHRGKGIKILQDAGIEVVSGVLEKECEELNKEFYQRMQSLKDY